MIPKDQLVDGGIYKGLDNRGLGWSESEMIWVVDPWGGNFYDAKEFLDNSGWPPSPFEYFTEETQYASFKPQELVRVHEE